MKKRSLLAAGIIAVLSTGCSQKESAEHFADAQKFLQQQNYNSAMIELKSAVQQEPENKDYRLALGKVYLKSGDLAAASKEFERAIELGIEKDLVVASLFRSYYGSRDFKSILSKFVDDNTIAANEHDYLDLYRALVEGDSEASDKANEIFQRLSKQQRNADVATFAEAAIQTNAKNLPGAIATLGKITDSSLLYPDALLFKARLQQTIGDDKAALASFQLYKPLMPRDFSAHIMMTQSLVALEQFDNAEKDLAVILKSFPEQPFANFLKAVVLYERKEYNGAKDHAERALNNGMKENRTRLLAALSAINLGLEAQALVHFDAMKDSLSALPELEALYASLLLKAGRADEVSKNLLAKDAAALDYRVIAATAYQLVKQGSASTARDLIKKYESTGKADTTAVAMLATVKLGVEGLEQQGLQELEQALKLDPNADNTRVVLAQNYIRQREYDKAEALADKWLTDPKQALIGHNLKAYIALLKDDSKAASQHLEKAQQDTPDNPFTLMLQAMVAARENQLQKSADILKKAVEIDSNYLPALSQYYAISKALQNPSDAVQKAEQMLAKKPDNAELRVLMGSIYLSENNPQATIDVLTGSNVKIQSKPPLYWALLLNAHSALKNNQQVVAISREWVAASPESADAELSYASALAGTGDHKKAIEIIDKYLKKSPNQPKLIRSKASYLADSGDFKAALQTIDQLGAEESNTAETLYIKGRLLAAAGETTKALETLQQSYQKSPNPASLAALADLTAAFRSTSQAAELIKTHIAKHGENAALQTLYANYTLSEKPAEAAAIYQKALDENSKDFVALNNHAWLLSEQNKLDEAAIQIRRALKLAPNHPDVLDTYGKILLRQKKYREAEETFEKSLEIRPKHAEVQLHYAEALLLTDQKDKAMVILSTVETTDKALLKLKAELEKGN